MVMLRSNVPKFPVNPLCTINQHITPIGTLVKVAFSALYRLS